MNSYINLKTDVIRLIFWLLYSAPPHHYNYQANTIFIQKDHIRIFRKLVSMF